MEQVSRDMATLQLLGHLLAIIFPEYEYTWLLPDFAESLGKMNDDDNVHFSASQCVIRSHLRLTRRSNFKMLGLELDFVQEGVNGERIACMVKNRTDVLIPHVHWE